MHEIPIRSFVVSVVAIRHRDNTSEVLLLKRTQTFANEWFQIAGSVEAGEAAWQAALREINEETGLTPIDLFSADYFEQFYEPPRDCITVVPVFVANIDPQDTVTLNHEHSDYRWMSFDDAVTMVPFPGQRKMLRWVEEEFVKERPNELLRIEIPPENV